MWVLKLGGDGGVVHRSVIIENYGNEDGDERHSRFVCDWDRGGMGLENV